MEQGNRIWQGCYNRPAGIAEAPRVGRFDENVCNPLGSTNFSFEVFRGRPKKKFHRSTRLGLIWIKHTVLGSSECVSSATQPTASSRKGLKGRGLWREDKSHLRSSALHSPLHLRLYQVFFEYKYLPSPKAQAGIPKMK